jgi:hypothetical protein
MNVLVTAASANGATGEIAQVISDVLATRGLLTMVIPPERTAPRTCGAGESILRETRKPNRTRHGWTAARCSRNSAACSTSC